MAVAANSTKNRRIRARDWFALNAGEVGGVKKDARDAWRAITAVHETV